MHNKKDNFKLSTIVYVRSIELKISKHIRRTCLRSVALEVEDTALIWMLTAAKKTKHPSKCKNVILTLLALGGGVFHVNFVCLLITFLVLSRLPPNLVTFHNWVLAKFSISKIKNRHFLVAMVTNLSTVVFCQNR